MSELFDCSRDYLIKDAVGGTGASESVLQKLGELSGQDIEAVKQVLDTVVPAYLSWVNVSIKMFL